MKKIVTSLLVLSTFAYLVPKESTDHSTPPCFQKSSQGETKDVNQASWFWKSTELHRLAQKKDEKSLAKLKTLLAHPAIKVNQKDRGGFTPLHEAVRFNNPKAVDLLLSHPNIEVDKADCFGFTPILCVAHSLELLQLFQKHNKLTPDNLNKTYERATKFSRPNLVKLKAALRQLGVIKSYF